MQSAEVIGIFGISIITVFVASVPALFATKHGLKAGLVCAFIMLCAHIGYGAVSLSLNVDQKTSHTIRLVQPSIDQAEKWDDDKRDDIFDTYLRLSSQAPTEGNERPSVIIWPEAAAPFILTKTPAALSKIADTLKIGQVLITGAIRLEENSGGQDSQYFNTIYVINDEGQIINSSDKMHLVPFGEYLPFEDLARRIGLAPLAETFGGFTAADQRKMLDVSNGLRLLPLICYEAIFPQYVDHGTDRVDAIINVTNDAWYGKTPGPYQHLRQAQLRSVESGLPLIRAGNNGLSVMTDNRGRIIAGMDLNYIGVSDTTLTTKRIPFWDNKSRNIAFLMLVLLFVIISVANRTKN
jgi:apolipoprotein N-acyltransferase